MMRRNDMKKKKKKKKLYRVEVRWVRVKKKKRFVKYNGWWEVQCSEGKRPYLTKAPAVHEGRSVARAHQPATLVIYTKAQRHQSERTYPRSRDPRRSKG